MLHMNQSLQYRTLYSELYNAYLTRGTPVSHYLAGMAVGFQIARGLNGEELQRLTSLVKAICNAK